MHRVVLALVLIGVQAFADELPKRNVALSIRSVGFLTLAEQATLDHLVPSG